MTNISFIYYFLFVSVSNVFNSKVLKILDAKLIFELFKISKKKNNLKNKNIKLKIFNNSYLFLFSK